MKAQEITHPEMEKQQSQFFFTASFFPLNNSKWLEITNFFFFFFASPQGMQKSQFPNQGSNLCRLHWECRVLTTGSPGKFNNCQLKLFLNSEFEQQNERVSRLTHQRKGIRRNQFFKIGFSKNTKLLNMYYHRLVTQEFSIMSYVF